MLASQSSTRSPAGAVRTRLWIWFAAWVRLCIGGASNDPQGPHCLGCRTRVLRCQAGFTGQHGPGSGFGIGRVGLPAATSCLSVGPVDLDDLDTSRCEVSREPGPVRTGALDPDLRDRSDRGHPRQQQGIALRCGVESGGSQDMADHVDHNGDVEVLVGIDAADDMRVEFCNGGRQVLLRDVERNGTAPCRPSRSGLDTLERVRSASSYQVTQFARPVDATTSARKPTIVRSTTRHPKSRSHPETDRDSRTNKPTLNKVSYPNQKPRAPRPQMRTMILHELD